MKFTVITFNDWTVPYWSDCEKANPRIVREKNKNEYEVSDMSLVIDLIKEWLDPPDHEMTEIDVRNDFDGPNRKLSDDAVKQIVTYYNGRYGIYNKFLTAFQSSLTAGMNRFALKFDIPFELNHFETDESDTSIGEQHSSYFEIIAEL